MQKITQTPPLRSYKTNVTHQADKQKRTEQKAMSFQHANFFGYPLLAGDLDLLSTKNNMPRINWEVCWLLDITHFDSNLQIFYHLC